jgi:hypothetical protein
MATIQSEIKGFNEAESVNDRRSRTGRPEVSLVTLVRARIAPSP